MKNVYTSKREIQSDVTFFLIVSKSALIVFFQFPYIINFT